MAAERRGLSFYRTMAQLFAHVASARGFFDDLASDEMIHIATLEEVRGRLTQDQLLREIEIPQMRRAERVHEIIADPRIEAIRTLDDAYELTHEFEASELNRMFLFLSSQDIPAQERHALLQTQIAEHQKKVSRFGRPPRGRTWRRSIQAHKIEDL